MPVPVEYVGSSPHSSGGAAESVRGTPETHITTFSPDGLSSKTLGKKPAVNLSSESSSTVSSGVNYSLGSTGTSTTDPFITNSAVGRVDQKLSATASSFQPFGVRNSMKVPAIASGSGSTASQQLMDSLAIGELYPVSRLTQRGTFSTDTSVSRALKVSGIHSAIGFEEVQECIQEIKIPSKASRRFYRINSGVIIRFTDIADTLMAYKHVKLSKPDWAVEHISPSACNEFHSPNSPPVSAHEAQLVLTVKLPTIEGVDRLAIEDLIIDVLCVDGELYAFQKQLATEAGTLRMVVEYCDVDAASRAVHRLNGAKVRGITFSASLHKPDIEPNSLRCRSVPNTPTKPPSQYGSVIEALNQISLGGPELGTVAQHGYPSMVSPTGRSYLPTPYPLTPSYSGVPAPYSTQLSGPPSSSGYPTPGLFYSPHYHDDNAGVIGPLRYSQVSPTLTPWNGMGSPIRASPRNSLSSQGRYLGRRQTGIRNAGNNSPFKNAVGQHNMVDVDRIRQGLDVRTTIMLRNIPNKIDQKLLKEIIDETSCGTYDFMYLRIDFANNCNVGYAFINFEDPWHIIKFVQTRAGQRWNRYNSDKVAEISYATIQGKDCLVQKFRNSSVMLENPDFRPKIFYTGNHINAGKEEDFPLPDNTSKMRRSVENAEHVGLFAPRAGQHYRDEQRRRRSQYDRGTRLAALEEFDYEDIGAHHSGGFFNF